MMPGDNQTTATKAGVGAAITGMLVILLNTYLLPQIGQPPLSQEFSLLFSTVGTWLFTRLVPAKTGAASGLMLFLFVLPTQSSCKTVPINGPRGAVAVAVAQVEIAADSITELCGNEKPGGDCIVGSPLSTGLRDALARELVRAIDVLRVAEQAAGLADRETLDGYLTQAQSILAAINATVARLESKE